MWGRGGLQDVQGLADARLPRRLPRHGRHRRPEAGCEAIRAIFIDGSLYLLHGLATASTWAAPSTRSRVRARGRRAQPTAAAGIPHRDRSCKAAHATRTPRNTCSGPPSTITLSLAVAHTAVYLLQLRTRPHGCLGGPAPLRRMRAPSAARRCPALRPPPLPLSLRSASRPHGRRLPDPALRPQPLLRHRPGAGGGARH